MKAIVSFLSILILLFAPVETARAQEYCITLRDGSQFQASTLKIVGDSLLLRDTQPVRGSVFIDSIAEIRIKQFPHSLKFAEIGGIGGAVVGLTIAVVTASQSHGDEFVSPGLLYVLVPAGVAAEGYLLGGLAGFVYDQLTGDIVFDLLKLDSASRANVLKELTQKQNNEP
jgi:hypothetical protein